MDILKFLNVISDLDNEQSDSSIDALLQGFATSISASQNSEIVANEQKIQKFFQDSKINSYVPSNVEIVNAIGAGKYFGNGAFEAIKEILNRSPYNIQKTYQELQEYIKSRSKFVTIVSSIREDLEGLGFEPYYPEDENFQVGLLMPSDYTKNKIINITKELNKWDKLLKTFKELIGEIPGDTEINFISNGSLDVFINNGPAVAAAIACAVDRIIKIYKNIVEIRQTREKLKDLGLPHSEQKVIEKQEKEHLNKDLDKLSLDLVREFASKKIEAGRLNELKVAVKGHVVYLAKCIDNGLTIEINPPEIDEPEVLKEEETEENKSDYKKAKVDYEKRLKQIEVVQKSMDTVKQLGKFGIDIGKFLTNGEDTKTEE